MNYWMAVCPVYNSLRREGIQLAWILLADFLLLPPSDIECIHKDFIREQSAANNVTVYLTHKAS